MVESEQPDEAGRVRPAWSSAPLELVDRDPAWVTRAVELAKRLNVILGRWRAGGVHHIGSTAVPGLAAVPTVDLMVRLHDDLGLEPAVRALTLRGWTPDPDRDGPLERPVLVLGYGARRLAELTVVGPHDPAWDERLAVLARLRADAGLRDRYAAGKAELILRLGGDRAGYLRAKDELFRVLFTG